MKAIATILWRYAEIQRLMSYSSTNTRGHLKPQTSKPTQGVSVNISGFRCLSVNLVIVWYEMEIMTMKAFRTAFFTAIELIKQRLAVVRFTPREIWRLFAESEAKR